LRYFSFVAGEFCAAKRSKPSARLPIGKPAAPGYKCTGRFLNFPNCFNNLTNMATAKPATKSNRKEIEAKKKLKRQARRAKQAASFKARLQKKREAKKAKAGAEAPKE
jgi:hypothetical protein